MAPKNLVGHPSVEAKSITKLRNKNRHVKGESIMPKLSFDVSVMVPHGSFYYINFKKKSLVEVSFKVLPTDGVVVFTP